LRFVGDIAPRQADIVQIANIQLGELTPGALALAPDMEGLSDLGEKPSSMMIYH
jgi:hypothetical protein